MVLADHPLILGEEETLTISLGGLANNAGRQSTLLDNQYTGDESDPAALIGVKIKSGSTAPTADTAYRVHLLRKGASFGDDGCGDSDAAITIENAPFIGSIIVTATANKTFYKWFDTAKLGALGPNFGIAIVNNSGQALSSTGGDHSVVVIRYKPGSR